MRRGLRMGSSDMCRDFLAGGALDYTMEYLVECYKSIAHLWFARLVTCQSARFEWSTLRVCEDLYQRKTAANVLAGRDSICGNNTIVKRPKPKTKRPNEQHGEVMGRSVLCHRASN